MKKIFIIFFIYLLVLAPLQIKAAKESYSSLYISIGEAIMHAKAFNWSEVDSALQQFKEDWSQLNKPNSPEKKAVTQALLDAENVLPKHNKGLMLEKLSTLSNALLAFDKMMNPVDVKAQREEVKLALTPVLDKLKDAILLEDKEKVNIAYKQLLSAWTRKESIVREQSIDYYGQFESKMGIMRIAIAKDEPIFSDAHYYYNELNETLADFVSGNEPKQSEQGEYSLQTLIDLLDKAIKNIGENQPELAVKSLEEFIIIWPAVEGEVQTRNGSLYTTLENNIPLIAGKLSSATVDLKLQSDQLKQFKQQIELLQTKNYTVWDAALIMLREGVEALLIVSALIAFLRKTNNANYQKWIWIGAFVGVLMSVIAALIMNMMYTSALAGSNREVLEGMTGIVAVILMIGVGVWLHQKSNLEAWNKYINTQMGKALSTGSILSMAFISFLSIFREGAETIIFYSGMAPSISSEKLVTGIAIAIFILAIVTFLFIRFSTKIPIAPFFKVATIFIYVLAFKILGVSLHALQLTNVMNTHLIKGMPVIDLIGFYPTWETTIPQLALVAIILTTAWIVAKDNKVKVTTEEIVSSNANA